VETLVAERNAARAAKNYAESDRIRAQLNDAGVLLDDKPGAGTQWRRA
jgi:cysteinyl-tRNA synthetase